MNRHSKDFKKLQRQWYKKLERDGFEDAEQENGALKVWSLSNWRSRYDSTRNSALSEYYRLAGHFLHDFPFESRFDERVWALHAEGMSGREIIAKLKSEGFKAYWDNILEVIHRLAKIMVQRVSKD